MAQVWPRVLLTLAGAAALAGACARTLPDQDRRITTTVAAVKLTAEDLWKDYQVNKADADRRYHGQALEVSGNVSEFSREGPAKYFVLFQQQKPFGVQANLLDDDAPAVLSSLTQGQRVTLKCFCEGLSENVVLKSCVKVGS